MGNGLEPPTRQVKKVGKRDGELEAARMAEASGALTQEDVQSGGSKFQRRADAGVRG